MATKGQKTNGRKNASYEPGGIGRTARDQGGEKKDQHEGGSSKRRKHSHGSEPQKTRVVPRGQGGRKGSRKT